DFNRRITAGIEHLTSINICHVWHITFAPLSFYLLLSAWFDLSNDSPVISFGFSTSSKSCNVGAKSAKIPPSRNFAPSFVTITGKGLIFWAVIGLPYYLTTSYEWLESAVCIV